MPTEERTRIAAASIQEPAGLGEVLEYWPLDLDEATLLTTKAGARRRSLRGCAICWPRVLLPCATATPPGQLALVTSRSSVVPTSSVRPSPMRSACSRSRLWCRACTCSTRRRRRSFFTVSRCGSIPTTRSQRLARTISYPTDLEALVARVLATPGRDAFRDDPAVASILAARDAGRDLGPVAAIDAIITFSKLRELCAGWGNTAQRIVNLDALRSHAVSYVRISGQSRDAATVVGLLRRFEVLAPNSTHWARVRTDRQALLAGEDAVTVSTWHRAKGLEWPITILFGLETMRAPTSFGVHVLTDRASFDIAGPLGGRWIRFWPNPYPSAQHGAVRTAIEQSPVHTTLVAKAHREALRVLYVGWTRARDRLVLAVLVCRGKLLDGIAGRLADVDPLLIHEPAADVPAGPHVVKWTGVELPIQIAPCQPAPSVAVPREPGTFAVGRPSTPHLPAHLRPSDAPPVACTIGESIRLGPRIPIVGTPNLEAVGDALHAFFAADRLTFDAADRIALATDLLDAHGIATHLATVDVVEMASRLWTWIETRLPRSRVHREWPIEHRLDTGPLVSGTADLVVTDGADFAVIDHKSFPGRMEAALQHARDHSGQLAAYAAAIRATTDVAFVATWIHFPIRGQLVEVRLDFSADGCGMQG